MIGWKVTAQVLVVLGAALSLGPVLQRIQVFLKRYRSYFEIVTAVVLFVFLAWFVPPFLERMAMLSWFAKYRWWKLMLESFLVIISLSIISFRRDKTLKENFLGLIPFLLLPVGLLVFECIRYSGRLFYFSFLYSFIYISVRISFWFAQFLTRVLRDELFPLLLAVFFLCFATAIQLFILN